MTKEIPCEDANKRRKEIIDVQRQVIAALFVSVLAVVPTVWMLMDRSPPYTFEYAEVIPNNVPQGGEINVVFSVIQNRPMCGYGVIYHEFREASGKIHTYDPVHRNDTPDIKNGKFTITRQLPENISLGPTIYRGIDCYTCNPLHSLLRWPICTATPNIRFNVIEAK